ncbi:MAG TPA: hypothetical protein VHL11_24990 [Phototrophicaceae bacterium]|jgi:hypothetical protein|nr:hypothetical protein [Phototrophicaceae bacterium]
MNEKSKIPDSGELLSQVFQFDESDLEANREGKLTQQQLTRITSERYRNILWIGMVILAGLIVLFLLEVIPIFSLAAEYTPFVMIGFGVLVSYRQFMLLLKLSRDSRERQINSVEGVIQLAVGGKDQTTDSLKIQDETFKLNRRQFFALKNHEPYTIYYLSNSRLIVSIEWLRDDNLMPEA